MKRRTFLASVGVALAELRLPRVIRAQESSLSAISEAAGRYGVSESWLLSTAMCETGGTLDPATYNLATGDTGLFQFQSSTYAAYCTGDPNDAYDAADCAAYMFSLGLCTHWCCSGCHPNPCD